MCCMLIIMVLERWLLRLLIFVLNGFLKRGIVIIICCYSDYEVCVVIKWLRSYIISGY